MFSTQVSAPQHIPLTGTASQIEWAMQIKPCVEAEFDRVAQALVTSSAGRGVQLEADVQVIIKILEDKRTEVLAHAPAGYFIRHWQELHGQVRKLICEDPRWRAVSDRRAAALV